MAGPAVSLTSLFFIALSVAVASWLATWLVLKLLRRLEIVDRPNRRSSHSAPTPRGGGLALVGCLLVSGALAAQLLPAPEGMAWLLAGTLILAAVSWADDLGHLSAALRLAVQALCVLPTLLVLCGGAAVFQGLLPPVLDKGIAVLLWLWFINLYNFMDGIDGLSATESMTLGFGLAAVAALTGVLQPLAVPGVIAGAAALGFFCWNRPPAKIFQGDVGAVPLGFFFGGLLLWAAAQGHWAVAVVLPLYYLVDATWTLLRRAARGGRFWEPHREHTYQRAVQAGLSHGAVVFRIFLCNLALVAAAVLAAAGRPLAALGLAAAAVAAVMAALRHRSGES